MEKIKEKSGFYGCYKNLLWPLRSVWLGAVMIVSSFLTGCSSTPKYTGKAYFCGLVVDEKNRAIEDFTVSVSQYGSEITNEGGMFTFDKVHSGKIQVKGRKPGYTEISQNVNVNRKDCVYVFQVKSADAVLEDARWYCNQGEYKKSLELMDDVVSEAKSPLRDVLLFYRNEIKKKMKSIQK